MQTELARRTSNAKQGTQVDYIYSAVNLAEFSPVEDLTRAELRARLGIDSDRFAIGYVAPFTARKAQLEFIKKAATLLKHSVPQTHIYFLGDFAPEENDYARRCQEAVRELGLAQSITFVGFTSDMADWYRAFDLLVVASRNEGLARCMIESLACGTPVVSFDVCSAREILEEHNCGVAVPQGDYQKLVQAIATLAHDNHMRRRLGAAAVAVSHELFDSRRIVARYEELYLSSMSN
jgi:glycosyltransferase involved in cell wall biosynthesis